MISYGNFLFRHRNWLLPLILVALFVGLPPIPAAGAPQTDIWLDAVGVVIVLAGLVLRGAVVGLAYIKRGGLQKKVYAAELVTDGMFAHSRNPLYVGNLLMLLGYFVIHNNPWIYLLGGPISCSPITPSLPPKKIICRGNSARDTRNTAATCRDGRSARPALRRPSGA